MFGRGATAADRLGLHQVPLILMYHRVAEVAENPLCVTPRRFAEQMTWLKRHGLRGVGVGTLVDAMRAGRQRGLVGITFDDGYVSVLEAAVPELARHGFGATAYIISGRLGGTNEWDEGPSWPLRASRSAHPPPRTCAWLAPARTSWRPRSAGAGPAWPSCSAPRSEDSPTPTARWTRRPGRPSARRATTTHAPW